jgi:hypothetical protein
MKMTHYDDFYARLSELLPLPEKHDAADGDNTTTHTAVDLNVATDQIDATIKRFRIMYALLPAEVQELKRMAVKQFDDYRDALANNPE